MERQCWRDIEAEFQGLGVGFVYTNGGVFWEGARIKRKRI